jgi:hypothetical protein
MPRSHSERQAGAAPQRVVPPETGLGLILLGHRDLQVAGAQVYFAEDGAAGHGPEQVLWQVHAVPITYLSRTVASLIARRSLHMRTSVYKPVDGSFLMAGIVALLAYWVPGGDGLDGLMKATSRSSPHFLLLISFSSGECRR